MLRAPVRRRLQQSAAECSRLQQTWPSSITSVKGPGSEWRHRQQDDPECEQSVAVWCSLLQSVAVRCSQLQSAAVCCSLMQSAAVCCSLPQSVAVCCGFVMATQRTGLSRVLTICCSLLQSATACYSLLWVRNGDAGNRFNKSECSLLQFVAVRCSELM